MNAEVLCVIPCRMGSKGVPGKNLREVNGRTLLARAVDFAKAFGGAVTVTSESPEALQQAIRAGAWGLRADPPKYHGDDSRAVDVWQHAWKNAERACGRVFPYSLYLEPSSPLREPWMAANALSALQSGRYQAAWTVEAVPLRYILAKQYAIVGGKLYPEVDGLEGVPRQQLATRFVQNGAIYAMTRAHLFGPRSGVFAHDGTYAVVTEPLVNIDTEEDLVEADRVLCLIENQQEK